MNKAASIDARRHYSGPTIFERGYRPFFFFAGLWGIVPLGLWLAVYFGMIEVGGMIDPTYWHVHEMLFGYAGSAIIGFALTAIPNWTGRLPVRGAALFILFAAWAAARVTSAFSLFYPIEFAAMLLDGLFFALFSLIVFREIMVGKNWRNLPIAIMITLIGTMAVLSHVNSLYWMMDVTAVHKGGLSLVIILISLVGGRIIPSFTRNWLAQRGEKTLPAPASKFDMFSIALSLVALLTWTFMGDDNIVLFLLLISAGVVGFIRLFRWAGHKTFAEPLVFILHVAFAWVPLGFFALAAACMGLIAESVAVHTWTAGAIAGMTLAVMTRATLGHSGRALAADKCITTLYAAITLAAIMRLTAGIMVDGQMFLMIAGGLWILAYLLFLWRFTPIFFKPKG